MRSVLKKRGSIMQFYLVQIILSAFIVLMFLMATSQKADSRYVKQQIVEKQIALLIDSASPGMRFIIDKTHISGYISDIRIEKGRVFVDIDGLLSIKGYDFFTKNIVSVKSEDNKFLIEVE
jgi:hypothetical protein